MELGTHIQTTHFADILRLCSEPGGNMNKSLFKVFIPLSLTLVACNTQPNLDIGTIEIYIPDETTLTQTTNNRTSAEPYAAQRGLSANETLSLKGTLSLDVNASG